MGGDVKEMFSENQIVLLSYIKWKFSEKRKNHSLE